MAKHIKNAIKAVVSFVVVAAIASLFGPMIAAY